MQPYLFPYIGYFQLLEAVDKFVFYDDVNFIKGGWINRNRLFLAGAVRYFTVPLIGASPFEKINKTRLQAGDEWAKSILSSVRQSYGKAPFYKPVADLLNGVLSGHDGMLSSIARNSVIDTAHYLGIEKEFVLSSEIYGNQDLRGAERVIDICNIENAKEYWNLPGGRSLYQENDFLRKGCCLKFVDVSISQYRQTTPDFHSGLSIIDVLMYNDPQSVKEMLGVNKK